MNWIICVLMFAGSLWAQPINGPFTVSVAEQPIRFTSPLTAIDSSGFLHVYYVERTGPESRVMNGVLDARSGEVVIPPSVVLISAVQEIELLDFVFSWSGEPVVLFARRLGETHQLVLLRPNDDDSPPIVLSEWTDTMDPNWGGSTFEIASARIVSLTADYGHVVYWLKEMTMTRIGEFGWCALLLDWPGVAFLDEADSVRVMQAPYLFMLSGESGEIIPAETLSQDSLYLWMGDYSTQQRLLVDTLSGFSESATIDCEAGNLAGQTFQSGTRVHLRGERAYNSPATTVTILEMHDEGCDHLTSYSCRGNVRRAVSHKDFGFALTGSYDNGIELLRIDSSGLEVATRGAIAWHEEGWRFNHSVCAIAADGLVATAWIEESASAGTQRLAFSSCDWLTPLDAHGPPVLIPKTFFLRAFPNPFNSSVQIEYVLQSTADVRLSIFNTLGQEIATLFDGRSEAGTHTLAWSPTGASGVYFVKLVAGELVTSQKILYIR